jgi:hypothetical protein
MLRLSWLRRSFMLRGFKQAAEKVIFDHILLFQGLKPNSIERMALFASLTHA